MFLFQDNAQIPSSHENDNQLQNMGWGEMKKILCVCQLFTQNISFSLFFQEHIQIPKLTGIQGRPFWHENEERNCYIEEKQPQNKLSFSCETQTVS